MKKVGFLLVVVSALALASCGTTGNAHLASATTKALQAFTLSDAQIVDYTKQFIDESDRTNTVAPANSPYTVRLNNLLKGVDTQGLNFKVYVTKDVNAFACADGSVRVYAGLMDLMTDQEVLGVLGHEIGHYKCKHTKEAFKHALMVSAARDAIGASSATIATLTDSQLGDIGESFLSAKFSRKEETEADNFGYDFLKSNKVNPWALAMAFEKLESLEQGSGATASSIQKLFASHPDTSDRVKNISARATADGYTRPAK
ncbi:metalloprotease [Bacteroidia bacterium]|nr:metalloprotease [Bacteroidia bacterium]